MANLRKHLQQYHKEKYKELLEIEEREQPRKRSKEDDKLLQPKINKILESVNPYSPASQHYVAITRAITRFIATDFQPFPS